MLALSSRSAVKLRGWRLAGPHGGRRRFWRLESSLRVPEVDVSDWVSATGRVPLTQVHEGSALSRLMHRFDGLSMRPSSPKPAFAIRKWGEIANLPPAGGALIPRHGGFRVRVWPHPGEERDHLRKSMRVPAVRQTRTLAFCTPDQFGVPAAPIQCLVVRTSKKTMGFGEDDAGEFVEMESADPLLSDFGHRKVFHRDVVPRNAIWMVAHDGHLPAELAGEPARDPKPPSGGRWWRLAVWPRWFFVPSLIVAFYLFVPWLAFKLAGIDGQLDAAIAVVAGILAVQAFFIVAVDIGLAASHLLTRLLVEWWWGPQWTTGTTGCVEDGRRLRNGLLP